MSLAHFVLILLAGMAAGTINTVVGSGSLITFPTLVALGYPPLLANVSNNIGLVPGSVSGVYGYRRELAGQLPRLQALTLVILQPKVSARVAARRAAGGMRHDVSPVLAALVCAAGVYGGYFGAAQGIILISVLGIFLDDELQRLNATKNVLAGSVNFVASIVFIATTHIDWKVVGTIAVGSTLGGQIGATVGRRLDKRVLRGLIVVVGLTALIRLL